MEHDARAVIRDAIRNALRVFESGPLRDRAEGLLGDPRI